MLNKLAALSIVPHDVPNERSNVIRALDHGQVIAEGRLTSPTCPIEFTDDERLVGVGGDGDLGVEERDVARVAVVRDDID